MRDGTKKLLRCICVILSLMFMIVCAEKTTVAAVTDLIEYDVVYTVATAENVTTLNAVFTVTNNETGTEQPLLIAAIYDVDKLIEMKTAEPEILPGATINEMISITIPNDKTDDYYIKLLVWEGMGTIRPLGKYKMVSDIDPYLREKLTYVTAAENTEFRIYMNASTVKGGNNEAIHTIEYDATEVTPTDLCGFTYENEMTAESIAGTNVVIEGIDTTNGIIKYKFLSGTGRNTGINNIIKFKSLTSITDAEIKYTIQ